MTPRKNKGCTIGLWVLFFTACITATTILLLLKIFGAVQITWFTVILPLIIGSGLPVVTILIVISIGFICGLFKGESDDD